MMTLPGLALFYSGMVRKKNVLATMAQSLIATVHRLAAVDRRRLHRSPSAARAPYIGTRRRSFLIGMGWNRP